MKVYKSVVGPSPRGEMLIWLEAFQLTGVVSSVEQPSRFLTGVVQCSCLPHLLQFPPTGPFRNLRSKQYIWLNPATRTRIKVFDSKTRRFHTLQSIDSARIRSAVTRGRPSSAPYKSTNHGPSFLTLLLGIGQERNPINCFSSFTQSYPCFPCSPCSLWYAAGSSFAAPSGMQPGYFRIRRANAPEKKMRLHHLHL
jgi:hypothetical protein